MTEWQPIETAPKDGSRILAYVSSKPDEASVCEIWWESDYREDEWGQRLGGWDDDWNLNHKPKAWMPIQPPNVKSAQARQRRRIDDLEAENKRLREALTPSAGTKAAYMGEFEMSIILSLPEGDTDYQRITVPWVVIKEIMAAMRKRAAMEDEG